MLRTSTRVAPYMAPPAAMLAPQGVSLALVNHMTDASRPSSTRLRRSSSAPMFDAMRTASDCAEPG